MEMSECKGPITTFIIEPFIPHNEEFYLNIVSERLGCSVSFSECGGIEIEENWDKVFRNVTFFFFSVSHIMFCLLSPALITLQNHNIRMVLSFVQVKTIFVPTGACLASETSAPLVATLPLEVIDLVGYPFLNFKFSMLLYSHALPPNSIRQTITYNEFP